MKDGRIKPKTETLSGRALLARWIVRGRMTQAEAAAQIGISRVKLNQYLNDEAGPSLETAIRIEDATGISVRTWLIEERVTEAKGAGEQGVAEAVQRVDGVTEVNIMPKACGKLGDF